MREPQGGAVTFFIPCLNESGNIGQAIENVISVMAGIGRPYQILVVDDASMDGSVAEVEETQRRHSGVRIDLIRNKYCRGLGRNYFIAAQRATGDYFMLVNGDAVEPPDTIRRIVSHAGEADAIIPYFSGQDSRTPARRVLSWSFTTLVNLISGHRLKYYNGPVLHRTENVRLWFAETAGFGYQAELLCRLLQEERISYIEVSVGNSDRAEGASKALRLRNMISVSYTLLQILLRRMQQVAFKLLKPERYYT